MKRPTKAIIPAAGFGTRFLPQTKAMPKEMLPIIDKPIIQYVVEELVAVVACHRQRALRRMADEAVSLLDEFIDALVAEDQAARLAEMEA